MTHHLRSIVPALCILLLASACSKEQVCASVGQVLSVAASTVPILASMAAGGALNAAAVADITKFSPGVQSLASLGVGTFCDSTGNLIPGKKPDAIEAIDHATRLLDIYHENQGTAEMTKALSATRAIAPADVGATLKLAAHIRAKIGG